MLGHAKLDTTQLYKWVSINLLRHATHPAANLKRKEPATTAREAEAEAAEDIDEEEES